MYPTEYLNSINVSGLPLSKLSLKVGCPVMVLRNLNPEEGVCNGTRGIVTRLANRVVEIRILGGTHAGRLVFIPRIKLEPTNAQIPFQLCRLQFPLRLAFAITINKSQGQSLKWQDFVYVQHAGARCARRHKAVHSHQTLALVR